jgi:ribokinase
VTWPAHNDRVTRILCVGLATVDLVYGVPSIPGTDEKSQATSLTIAAGGPAANAAITAAALGAEVTLVTAVGAHPLADLVRDDLRTHGVTLIDVEPHSPGPPPVSSVIVHESTGERTIVSRNAGDRTARPPEGGLPEADLTLVDGHHPALAVAAARTARRLLVDAGSWRPVFHEIFPHAEVVACSAAFRHPAAPAPATGWPAAAVGPAAGWSAAALGPAAGWPAAALGPAAGWPAAALGPAAGWPAIGRPAGDADAGVPPDAPAGVSADAATAAAIGAPHVAVTHGPGPVFWFSGSASGQVAVPTVAAVDTAGAGDAFHGALAVALARGEELPVALGSAVRIAGVRVVHRGPRAWLGAL